MFCFQGINWLRESCLEGLSAILADEQGLGKSASVVTFILSLRHEFNSLGPMLVIMPPARLAFWEGEFRFWAGSSLNVISYVGSAASRGIIHDHELWLSPGSMDGRSTLNIQNWLPDKVLCFYLRGSVSLHQSTESFGSNMHHTLPSEVKEICIP